jgi:uncharacterized damage-inducible protein DinB
MYLSQLAKKDDNSIERTNFLTAPIGTGNHVNQLSPPKFPAGPYIEKPYSAEEKSRLIDQLANVPQDVRSSVDGLTESQLDAKYNNWTIRQIVHHLADSHINCYVRYKWALTEASPLIKTYNESKWSEVVDARTHPIESSLTILDGVHSRWSQLVRELTDEQLELTFFHPELMKSVSLREALPSYVWHAQHHCAQINWMRENCQF